jgi:protein-S-isoprenylcysteine O-methyltransferase Ste14
VLPIVAATEAALRRTHPRPGYLPLLAWGYLQYRWCGTYRSRGGGGPGMSVPPERLVTTGPYALTRNPMYLGHLVFAAGVAAVTHSRAATLTAAVLPWWFDRRVRRDERRMAELFGAEYAGYCSRVPRWVPAASITSISPAVRTRHTRGKT